MKSWSPSLRSSAAGLALAAAILAGGAASVGLPLHAGEAPSMTGSAEPLRIESGTEVVRAWQPHQRLYVKGDLGLGMPVLAGLEQWLDANATNWVVVLLESAAGESWPTADGRTFSGIEAVNFALGQGLLGQTAFGQGVDARTGERNACFFALFLKDRRFSYYGSDAQDRRGLGEDQWIGNLDAPAVSAMRNGGRVVDAVKDTIRQIEGRLTARIEAERQAVARQAAEAESARARIEGEAQAAVRSAAEGLATLEARTTAFVAARPEMTGNLARPELPGLRARLADAERMLAAGEFATARERALGLATQTSALLKAQDEHRAAAATFDELGGRHQVLAQHPQAAAARETLRGAAEHLVRAREAHRRGDSAYVGGLAAAREGVQRAEAVVGMAESTARAAALAGALAAGGTFAGLTVLALLLNRRRLKVKLEAESALANLTTALREKTDALFALLDRRAMVVGASSIEAARRYTGVTLALSRQAIQDVDELFIMSACVDRVLADAERLLRPPSLAGRLANRFRRRSYRRVLRLLRDEPISFRPDEGLELIVRGTRTERDRLLGDVHAYQPFAMTFEALIAAFNERAARALAAFDRIEAAAPAVTAVAEQAQRDAEAATAALNELATGAQVDGRLALAPVRERLLPAATEALAALLKQAAGDPVGAQAEAAPLAARRASEAAALTTTTAKARRERLPLLQQHARTLEAARVDPGWIDAAVGRLSAQGDELGREAVERPVLDSVRQLDAAWDELVARAAQAVTLDARRRGESLSALEAAEAAVVAARAEIGAALGLAADRTLREADTDPSVVLARARTQWQDALAGLDRGDVAAAESALAAAGWLCGEAQGIIAASRKTLADRATVVAALRAEADALATQLPAHRQILAEVTAGYAASVLALGAGDPLHPQANGTVSDNVAEAEGALAEARTRVAEAETAFAGARLLEARTGWDRAQAALETGRVRLLEIVEKRDRLVAAVAANRLRIDEIEAQARAAQALADTATTMAPTRARFAAAQERLARLREPVHAGGGDPFALAGELTAVATAFTAAADLARCDRDVFEEARRSARAATAQLSEAQLAAGAVRRSDAPESRPALAALDELSGLVPALAATERALDQPHGDWNTLDAAADRIHADAARIAATLRGELEKATAAMAMLTTAAGAVRRAGGWTGGYGVTIPGAPGGDALAEARDWLQRGEYERARSLADSARRVAETALAAAAAEVMRRQAEEEARQERERRRRQAEAAAREMRRSTSHGGGFGGLGGSRGSSSWGGSGSGARSSSFSSGSGARTSGW